MKRLYTAIVGGILAVGTSFSASAQCPAGQVEVYIDVITDNYGYETYWELVPSGNGCGNGTLFSGGNTAVGCNGGGAQNQTPGGYGNNLTITEGPWCLTEGASYDIIWVDDWGDDGLNFEVRVNGYVNSSFEGTGAGNTFTFIAEDPPATDLAATGLLLPIYMGTGSHDIVGTVFNYGTDAVTSFDLNWQATGGTVVTQSITGVNIANFESYEVTHPTPWTVWTDGIYQVDFWVSNINGGQTDANPNNDQVFGSTEVGPARPNIIDGYLNATPTFTVIGNASDQLSTPRDLDFHPILTKKELWVINKDTEQSGGSTVRFDDAGEPTQVSEWKRDGNAWHFMSLPTGIAFSTENGNFATAHGVYDANHQGGASDPFSGPTLWSSDPNIYAENAGPGTNGSHLDMLHESPYCQGIAHERGNAFWVFDGNENDIVMYDFVEDHGPGMHDHSDGIVRRYSDVTVAKDPNDHIVSHMELDKSTGWLYVVDHGNDRVFRMDINSGTQGPTPTYGPWEPLAEYSSVTGYTVEDLVTTGLVEPAGLALMGDRMLISDHSNGDIIIYDISTAPAVELGRIQTGAGGIMGLTIGPEGRIWYVNATTEQVVRIDGVNVGLEEETFGSNFTVFPNPSNGNFDITIESISDAGDVVTIYNSVGAIVHTEQLQLTTTSLDLNLAQGVYNVELSNANGVSVKRLVVQ